MTQRLIIQPFDRFLERLLLYMPTLLTAVLILLLGFAVAALFKFGLARLGKAVGVDALAERTGLAEMLRKSGITDPLSHLSARIIAGITIVVFAVIAMQTLEIPAVDRLLETFFLYLPNVFVAFIILFIGYLLSNFLARGALIASVNAGLKVSRVISKLVKAAVLILAVTMALEQLGIGRDTVILSFSITFGGIVLALALAFGLGGKDIAKAYLERKMAGKKEKNDLHHL